MDGKIVFEGKTKKGTDIIIRYPNRKDAQEMCDYINTLSLEQTFIAFQGEQNTLESETKYLNEQLEKIKKRIAVLLLAYCDEKLIGVSGIDLMDKATSHEGVFGISIAKDFRGEGIGKILMTHVLEEAEKNLPELKIVTLGVFGGNDLAYGMYEKFGFKEFGRLPGGIKHKGNYVDHVYMYKNIRE